MSKKFAAVHAAASPELRYLLDERAAIHQHDGKATREAAEEMALAAYEAARAGRSPRNISKEKACARRA